MNENVTTEEQTAKLTERQQSLLNLASDFYRSAAVLIGTTNIKVDIGIEVPEEKLEPWMEPRLEEGHVGVYMRDDSLPF